MKTVKFEGPKTARIIPSLPVGRCSLMMEDIKAFNHHSGEEESVTNLQIQEPLQTLRIWIFFKEWERLKYQPKGISPS